MTRARIVYSFSLLFTLNSRNDLRGVLDGCSVHLSFSLSSTVSPNTASASHPNVDLEGMTLPHARPYLRVSR